jgi:hypothetical protein
MLSFVPMAAAQGAGRLPADGQAHAAAEAARLEGEAAISRDSRRAAERQGHTLSKIRRIDPQAIGYGRWHLRGRDGNVLIGDETARASLDEVERYLADER